MMSAVYPLPKKPMHKYPGGWNPEQESWASWKERVGKRFRREKARQWMHTISHHVIATDTNRWYEFPRFLLRRIP